MRSTPLLDKLCVWASKRIPIRLLYFVTLRAWAVATSGKWSHTVAPDITVPTVLQRLDELKTVLTWRFFSMIVQVTQFWRPNGGQKKCKVII